MKTTNVFKNYQEEKEFFFEKWYHYREQRLSKFKYKPFEFIHYDNRIEDLEFYNDYQGRSKTKDYSRFGGSGLSATIISYDCLLMSIVSKNIPINLNSNDLVVSLDSLLFFSALHFGDNDTTGAITGAWYGALVGFNNFDKKKLSQLEFSKEIDKLIDLIGFH